MSLWLFHPALLAFSCADCQKWVYDFDTGERKTYRRGPKREEVPMTWPRGTAPPCKTCPKESPAKERDHILNFRNLKTLAIYQQVRATSGHCLTEAERADPVLRQNLAIIDAIVRKYEHHQLISDLCKYGRSPI